LAYANQIQNSHIQLNMRKICASENMRKKFQDGSHKTETPDDYNFEIEEPTDQLRVHALPLNSRW
jgi:hypothetical protein